MDRTIHWKAVRDRSFFKGCGGGGLVGFRGGHVKKWFQRGAYPKKMKRGDQAKKKVMKKWYKV